MVFSASLYTKIRGIINKFAIMPIYKVSSTATDFKEIIMANI